MRSNDLLSDDYEEKCIQEDYVKHCQQNTPQEFVSADKKPTAYDVAELIELLNKLPKEMIIESGEGVGIQLIVFNYKTDPHLKFREIDY